MIIWIEIFILIFSKWMLVILHFKLLLLRSRSSSISDRGFFDMIEKLMLRIIIGSFTLLIDNASGASKGLTW